MIPYQGGKRQELKHIEKAVPESTKIFIDAYGGGGSVSLWAASKKYKTIYNDLSKFTTTLATYIKDKRSAEIESIIDSFPTTVEFRKKLIEKHPKFIVPDNCDLNQFCEILYLKLSCYRGVSWNTPNITKTVMGVSPAYKKFKSLELLFELIEIRNEDAIDLIMKHKDDPDTVIYLDPPYISTSQSLYQKKINNEMLGKLISFLKSNDYKATILLHIELIGYVYDHFRDKIRVYYPKKYSSSNGQSLYQKYICLCVFEHHEM